MAFSDEGLREQLAFEGFPQDAIDYAMENITVNWNEKALEKAENYLDLMAFSDEGLREQLAFEDFPQDAIDYAMENIMVDWNEQARKKAEDYLQLDMGMSGSKFIRSTYL